MKRRDLDLLSSYLDGQLKPSDSARLEARLASDPELRAVLDDLRAARGLLRQLPLRKAPRNFTLTPAMVRKDPPLPRSYFAFRFVTAFASLLLFFSLGLRVLGPQLAQPNPYGMGGGGAPDVFSAAEAPAVQEAAATEAAAEPAAELVPAPTMTAADNSREVETPVEKEGLIGDAPAQSQPAVPAFVSSGWLMVLAAISLAGALIMLLLRQAAARRWR